VRKDETEVDQPTGANPYLPAHLPPDYGINVGNMSEYDIPTYLRRQMD
jgi:hypothetical protein